ncbi:hypothetical protein TNCV_4283421 [Trichonephila clavipes]|nr:hypothetical protein TNCV_4283421 [Trichonephila clavipes]
MSFLITAIYHFKFFPHLFFEISKHLRSPAILVIIFQNRGLVLNKAAQYKGPPLEERVYASGALKTPAQISSQSSHHCWRSPLPHASALIQRDFRCVLGVQQTKQLPHVAKVDPVWQLGVQSGSIVEKPRTTCFLLAKYPDSEAAMEAIQSGD